MKQFIAGMVCALALYNADKHMQDPYHYAYDVLEYWYDVNYLWFLLVAMLSAFYAGIQSFKQ